MGCLHCRAHSLARRSLIVRLIASLPWYDLPPAKAGLDAFWQQLRHELALHCEQDLPLRLERQLPLHELWASPGLLLSQCCGPDLFTPAARYLVPVARPVFAHLNCEPGQYYSHIVSAKARLPSRPRLVINAASSRSGCGALYQWLRAHHIEPGTVRISGGHAQSLECLRAGYADIAAIDAHSWTLLDTRHLHILDRSAPALSPPFVMHAGSPISPPVLQAALSNAVSHCGEAIGIQQLCAAKRQDYQRSGCNESTAAVYWRP